MHLERRMIVDACHRAIAETRRLLILRPGLLLAYGALSAIAFAYAWHLAWVCDDAYISFRYARNLAEGNGLVFNVGERVEGYTNFLWVLEMALLHLLGIPLPAASQVLSGLLSVAVLALSIRMALAGPARAFRHFSAVVALGVLATSRHVAMWATSGLETRQFTWFILLAVYLVHGARGRTGWLLAASFSLAGAVLTRPEAPLIAVSVAVWYWIDSHRRECFSWDGLRALVLPCAAVIAVHLVWRHSYYGDWLPNTYYAKVVRSWPDAGIHYGFAFAVESGLYLALPLALVGGLFRYAHRRDSLHLLGALILVPYTLYVVSIGGDHFEFRVFDLLWPLLALAVADGLVFFALSIQVLARRRRWLRPRLLGLAWGTCLAVGFVVYGTVLQVAHYTLTYDADDEAHMPDTRVTAQRFPLAHALPILSTLTPLYDSSMEFLNKRFIAWRLFGHQLFAARQHREYTPYTRPDRRRLPPGMIMAYNCVGIMPYGFPELTIIDTLGLVDRTVARSGGAPNSERRMAHDRSPPPGYLEARGVNIDIRPAAVSRDQALRRGTYAVQLADDLWMPFESPRGSWAEASFRGFPLYQRPSATGGDAPGTRAIVADRRLRGAVLVGGFEGTDDGWTLQGPVVEQRGTPGRETVQGQAGVGYLSSYGAGGDADRGSALSREFVVGVGDSLVFKVAGGSSSSVGVELIVGTATARTWRGEDSEAFEWVLVDLAPYAGQSARLRLYDSAAGAWGHLMLDHVVLMRP